LVEKSVPVQLPKDALQRVQIGQSFAEYDLIREHPTLFVSTPASLAATQPDNNRCFFIGRRGAGKTAIAYHILQKNRRAVSIAPQVFDVLKLPLANEEFHDTRQRPFKSLVCAIERALLGELISLWRKTRVWAFNDRAPNINKWIGDLIKLCFFRSLTNVQPKERSYQGVVIRDWIASNRASVGFWRMVREKYGATQIIWECKNYTHIGADDFQQVSYYLNDIGGRFAVAAYRGMEIDSSYYRHIQRIAQQGGLVLLLTEKDLRVFVRQAINGKVKEDHVSELFDRTVRAVS
jgi:hypothetical protein